jgi:hypothetical protein
MGLLRGVERGEIYPDRAKYLLEPDGKYDLDKKFLEKYFDPDFFFKNWVFRQTRYDTWPFRIAKSSRSL